MKSNSGGNWSFCQDVKKEWHEQPPTPDEIRRVMSAMGRVGGLKGGKARAVALSREKRVQIAKMGVQARWGKRG